MTQRLILTFCICFVSGWFSSVCGQTYSLQGKVTDETGTPLENVRIYLSEAEENKTGKSTGVVSATSGSVSTRTDSDGSFSFDDLEIGSYTITAYYPGKRIETQLVSLPEDRNIDFRLMMLENTLDQIIVGGEQQETYGISRLRSVEGVTINEAKKNEVLVIEDMNANLATNNSRQIYSKVAGLNIWQSDDAGLQTSVGGRGLSPKRNSNFNTRQNGYDIAADALGYPESYYTPPVQALKRIEIIRGAASLQYGTQFGGMLNFVFKDGPTNEPFEFTSSQTVGSHGLFNSFNSTGGSTDKLNYYGFYQYKTSNGWRPNSDLNQHTAYSSVEIEITPKLTINPEFTYMYYRAQQPGGLTDAQFESNPQQSNRERNWFQVNWNLLGLKANYAFSSKTLLNTRFFGLKAGRDAIGNLERIDRLDFGGNRNLLKDDYRNWGNETRLIHRYSFLGDISVFLAGTRLYNGFTHRRQGEGSAGSDPDFSYQNPGNLEGSDFDLPSRNRSMFIENIFNITPSLSITPGVRFEYIRTESDGYYRNIVRDLAGNVLVDDRIEEQRTRERSFLFYGIGLSYKKSDRLEIYGNYSQNYRAINFNDIRVDVGNLEVDPDIRDEQGFNIDLGIRGNSGMIFNYDLTVFHLSYKDRIGTVLRTEPNPRFNNLVDRTFRYRTNVADADIYGVESFAELDLYKLFVNKTVQTRLSVFSNLALIKARYTNSDENGIEGNNVELVPEMNFKTGLTFAHKNLEVSYQFSHISEHFSDASNAKRTPTAIEGIIPSYQVMDLSLKYSFDRYRLETGVNNLADERYFTRRATGYPGPGIIPAKTRSFYLTVGINL